VAAMRTPVMVLQCRGSGGDSLGCPTALHAGIVGQCDVAMAAERLAWLPLSRPNHRTCPGVTMQLVTFNGKTLLDFVLLSSKLRSGTHVLERGVTVRDVQQVEVLAPLGGSAPSRQIMLELDGEVLGFAPAAIECIPGAIELIY
jgi:YegS C-terminal NAD kinase beta sandwich-like domain